jgi:hemoglobin
MSDVSSRANVFLVVSTFYTKVRKDALPGPIFNLLIADWEGHFEHLIDFWESNLFFKKIYYRDPLKKHVGIDEGVKGQISELHFGI